ncbi:MAG TPA: DUF4252 domain-containing protein [Opitutaceae bacterium]|nr:DUF4252 domain-containing protein [Opitutaceae bacterium]
MNRSLRRLIAPCTLALLVTTAAVAVEPGYVDFGRFAGPKKGEYVEVTLGKGMLKLASLITRHHNPEASDIISGLTRVRVNVVGLDDANRDSTTERVKTLRQDLGQQGWEQIVSVRGKRDEDVAVFVKQREGEVIDGIVVTVVDGRKNEAVFVNVVGKIKPEQLAMLGEQLDIKPLKGAVKAKEI